MKKKEAAALIKGRAFDKLKDTLTHMLPADIAALSEDCGTKELTIIFRLLPTDLAAETFAYMSSGRQKTLINALSDKELKAVLRELFLDDTVDIIEEMPANVVSRIIKAADPAKRRQINELLSYAEDSAGSVMTTEFVYLDKNNTVEDALKRIKAVGLAKETVYTCYVTDRRQLIGSVSLLDMVVCDKDKMISDIMDTPVVSVSVSEDRETVANIFTRHGFAALPVTDSENRIVGIITFDDIMDVIREENAEDISMMSAVVPGEESYLKTSSLKHAKSRIVWLLVLMLSATVTGAVTSRFEAQIAAMPLLVAFMPMLTDTGGNCGSQSSAMVIRAMASEEIGNKDFFRVMGKEFSVALICGVILCAVNFIRIIIMYKNILMAATVTVALMCTIILSKLLGGVLPMLARRMKLDPAVMSGPLITTIVDSCSVLIYFTAAVRILKI